MRLFWCDLGSGCRQGEEVRDRVCAKAGKDEMSESKFNVVRLVCPLIMFWLWVEELYVCM